MLGGVVDGENNVGGLGGGGGAGHEVLEEIRWSGLGTRQFDKSEPLEVGPHEVVGSSQPWSGGYWVLEASGGSQYCLRMQVVYI